MRIFLGNHTLIQNKILFKEKLINWIYARLESYIIMPYQTLYELIETELFRSDISDCTLSM